MWFELSAILLYCNSMNELSPTPPGEQEERRHETEATPEMVFTLAEQCLFEPNDVFTKGGVTGDAQEKIPGSKVTISGGTRRESMSRSRGKEVYYEPHHETRGLAMGWSVSEQNPEKTRLAYKFSFDFPPNERSVRRGACQEVWIHKRDSPEPGAIVRKTSSLVLSRDGDGITAKIYEDRAEHPASPEEVMDFYSGMEAFIQRHNAVREWEAAAKPAFNEARQAAEKEYRKSLLGRATLGSRKREQQRSTVGIEAYWAAYREAFPPELAWSNWDSSSH